MNQVQRQDFDWSDCSVADQGNRAFLKGERDFITEQKDRQFKAIFLPLFLAGVVYVVLFYKTPLWFSVPVAVLVWLIGFGAEQDNIRKLKRLAPGAVLIKGEVFAVSHSSHYENGAKLSIRFQTPEGAIQETETHADISPYCQWWSVGDKCVVLFADDENFWVL